MATNGLRAEQYRGWIDNSIIVDESLKILFSEFVVGSPAYGLSKKGRNFCEYYGYKDISEYESLLTDLIEIIDFNAFEKYEELKDAILKSENVSFEGTLPKKLVECIFIYAGSVSDNDFFKQYFKTDTTSKGKKKEDKKSESTKRKKVIYVDKLFYHLRNGLAHGCYSVVEQTGEKYLILQDESKDGSISARMILKFTTLSKWIYYLANRKLSLQNINLEKERKELCHV